MTRACRTCGFRTCRCGTLGPCDICREPIQKSDILGSYAGKYVHHDCALTMLDMDRSQSERRTTDDERARA